MNFSPLDRYLCERSRAVFLLAAFKGRSGSDQTKGDQGDFLRWMVLSKIHEWILEKLNSQQGLT